MLLIWVSHLIICILSSLILCLALSSKLAPITLSLVLLLYSILTSFILGTLYFRWIFYFLMLVFLGGVMIVIIFISSVCERKKLFSLQFNKQNIIGVLINMPLLGVIIMTNSQQSGISVGMYLYNTNNIVLLIGIITILLIILLAVVLMVNLEIGPLLKRLYFDSLRKISHCGCEDV